MEKSLVSILQQASILVFCQFILIDHSLELRLTCISLRISELMSQWLKHLQMRSFQVLQDFTTGGISLFEEPENLAQSFTFLSEAYTQLVGGMSFIYLSDYSILSRIKTSFHEGFYFRQNIAHEELFGTITIIFALYIVIVALLLWVFGERNLMDNFSLAMSTLATGGFLPNSTILQDLLWQEEIVLMGAMILGALPFTFHYGFVRKKFLSQN